MGYGGKYYNIVSTQCLKPPILETERETGGGPSERESIIELKRGSEASESEKRHRDRGRRGRAARRIAQRDRESESERARERIQLICLAPMPLIDQYQRQARFFFSKQKTRTTKSVRVC